ncbi:MAG: bifunctional oligoribonuclease/PAP phosphatase NrnA [Clostridia bacterium]|nr:bifunctional oligoribonuclease/PAP phosphatase NrnA [Clostridia bacterium]MBQ3228839.1 bifunctional oligoribonuclease/PAP phosphatase NrnA [Clostridia bacterium]
MSRELMSAVLEKIKEYDRIFIFRHIRPDGDCVGSSKGLCEILRLSFPEKDVRVVDWQKCDYLAFLDIEEESVDDSLYADALAVVVDTATSERISNQKYKLCREIVKIDHHIPVEDYGSINWVEEHSSSTCEMISRFYLEFKDQLKINERAATLIYTGMVTDSGRFRFRSVSGDTMRAAGAILEVGINTDRLYANLYIDDFDQLRFKAHVYNKMKITENGVAYIHVTSKMQERFALTAEKASASVSYMDSIRDSLIWIAFIDNSDGTIRVRLRSRFVTINDIAEKYRGGGHACASGATLLKKSEIRKLLDEADQKLKEYKESNEGWI